MLLHYTKHENGKCKRLLGNLWEITNNWYSIYIYYYSPKTLYIFIYIVKINLFCNISQLGNLWEIFRAYCPKGLTAFMRIIL